MSQPTTVRFRDDEVQRLNQLAARRRTTVSALVQEAVRAHLLAPPRRRRTDQLLAWIAANPVDIHLDPDELDDRIDDAMTDAAR